MRIMASPGIRAKHKNPYTSLLYEQMYELGVEVCEATPREIFFGRELAIWHLHWPDGALNYNSTVKVVFKLFKLFTQIYWAKARGIKIVWTAHNLRAHEQLHPAIEPWFWRIFLASVDGVISLSETGRRMSRDCFPRLQVKPGFVIPHGHYKGVYPDAVTRLQARDKLDLEPSCRVALFLGHIRPYKNVTQLIHAFRDLKDANFRLQIAGIPSTDALRQEVQAAQNGDARIATHLHFVPTDQVQMYLRAADLMVLPYETVLNSGVALLSLSFDCPVLAPGKGSLVELREEVGSDWVNLFSSQLSAEVLQEAMVWSVKQRATSPDLCSHDRQVTAQATLDAYKSLVGSQ